MKDVDCPGTGRRSEEERMMKRVVPYILIAVFLAALLWLVPSEKVVAESVVVIGATAAPEETAEPEPTETPAPQGRIEPIPLDLAVMAPIDERFYTGPMSYEDPSIRVEITEGRAYDTDYMVARVKIADPSQLRSAMHGKKGQGEDYADRIARRVNAVLAINGDEFRVNKPNDTRKYIVRQGQDVFIQNWRNKCYYDILVMDDKGDLIIVQTPTRDEMDAFAAEHTIVNSFCFGPALIIDGERIPMPTNSLRANGVGWTRRAQRMAICQTGSLEYMMVVTGGTDTPGSIGMTIDEFVDVIIEEGHPITAYNMDGGNSAWLVFHNEKQNDFNRHGGGRRKITDIIYFASAWTEE